MPGRKTVAATLGLLVGAGLLFASHPVPPKWRQAGEQAFEWTRRVVELGPRPPGSAAHQKAQKLILEALRQTRATVVEDRFTPQTPKGPLPMNNLIAKFPGSSGRVIVISGHYDTYSRPGLHFVGANDGGSSTGFLLALAESLDARPRQDGVWLVFFDGEESLVRWENNDHTYGSRRLATQWSHDGTARKIKALINVDMIGDAGLRLAYEQHSTAWLRDLIWKAAARLGYETVFPTGPPSYLEDDHVPFVDAGIPAVDLIDFDYGLFNRNWHSERDTLDKLSPTSLAIMLHVVDEAIAELEKVP